MSNAQSALYQDLVAPGNLHAYCALYAIEIGLREFMIATLHHEAKWWNRRLPADVLEKYRKGRDLERSIPWIHLCPHHPLYYIDFPDLRKVIERNDNWRDVFLDVFGDKVIICGSLRGLEPIRNNVAHNRRLSHADAQYARQVADQIAVCIGQDRFGILIAERTTAEDAMTYLKALRQELGELRVACLDTTPIQQAGCWIAAPDWWWLDSDYLGHSVEQILSLCELLSRYSELPRHRGTGHTLEQWVLSHNMAHEFECAIAELDAILAEGSFDDAS